MQVIKRSRSGLSFVVSSTCEHSNKTSIRLQDDTRSIEVDMPLQAFLKAWNEWQTGGKFIQDAFATLSHNEREFFMTGMTPEEWDDLFHEFAREINVAVRDSQYRRYKEEFPLVD